MQIEEMLEAIRDKIDDEVQSRSEGVVSGRFNTFEDYKFAAGLVAGLKLSSTLIRDALREYTEKD